MYALTLGDDPWSMALLNKVRSRAHYKTLGMWRDGSCDHTATPYYKWLKNAVAQRSEVWGFIRTEEDILAQCDKFYKMFLAAPNWNVMEKSQSDTVVDGETITWHYGPICVKIENDGGFFIYDGNHRLAILSFLNLPIEVMVCEVGEEWSRLVRDLNDLYPNKMLYQPIPHPEFSGWKCPMDKTRDELLNKWLAENGVDEVVDLGTCHGYVPYVLRNVLKKATGVEPHAVRRRVASLVLSKLGHTCSGNTLESFLAIARATGEKHRCVMALNVLHHVMSRSSAENFRDIVKDMNNMCDFFIYSLPVPHEQQWMWMNEEARKDEHYISRITGMKEVAAFDLKPRKLVVCRHES